MSSIAIFAESGPVSKHEQDQWLLHTIPLPQEIEIKRKVQVPLDQLHFTIDENAGTIGEQILKEWNDILRPSQGRGRGFEIRYQIAGHAALNGVPNSNQSYIIEPVSESLLAITAPDPKGLYYATQTLKDLLRPTLTEAHVIIPLMRVLDYPDFEERGLWNVPDHEAMIPWLASMKMNFSKMHETEILPVEKGKPGQVKIPVDLMMFARRRAFNLCPTITHVNFAGTDSGLFRLYPETAGKGDEAVAGLYFAHLAGGYRVGDQARVPNASHPVFIRYVTDWVRDIARQGGRDISCWLSERPASDQRPETLAFGQFLLEARAFIAAWEEVRLEYPDLEIRLFLSTTTNERYEQILAEAPPEVKIERCCSQDLERVPYEPRDLTRNPLLEEHAKQGRWIASYDVPVGAFVQVETPDVKLPMRSPQMVRHSIRQYHDQGYKAAYSMMMLTWGKYQKEICGLNIAAAAEYAWNVNGRSERDLALAFATREGLLNPEAVAAWVEIMGPLEFDVYGSYMPMAISRGWAADMVCERRFPVLGQGIFRYYRSPEDFADKLAACDRASAIAKGIDPDYLNETMVVKTYIHLMHDVYRLALLTATASLEEPADQKKLRVLLEELQAHGDANVEAIRAWRRHLGPEPEEEWAVERIDRGIRYTSEMVAKIHGYLAGRYSYLIERAIED